MWKWLITSGVVLGIITVFLINRHINAIESKQTSVTFIKLKANVNYGDELVIPQHLKSFSLPEKFSSLSDILIPYNEKNRTFLSNNKKLRFKRDIKEGDFLRWSDFRDIQQNRFSAKIAKGMRAITLPVNQSNAVSFFIAPGSIVDIIGSMTIPPKEKDEEPLLLTKTFLQNIKVLAVGMNTSRQRYLENDSPQYNTVTFEVTPIQAEILVFAAQEANGGLTLVLKNPTNLKEVEIPSVSWDDLQGNE
jgi:Flp pilus assembly protein CpaB